MARASGTRPAVSASSTAAPIPIANAPASPASIEIVPASASAMLAPYLERGDEPTREEIRELTER